MKRVGDGAHWKYMRSLRAVDSYGSWRCVLRKSYLQTLIIWASPRQALSRDWLVHRPGSSPGWNSIRSKGAKACVNAGARPASDVLPNVGRMASCRLITNGELKMNQAGAALAAARKKADKVWRDAWAVEVDRQSSGRQCDVHPELLGAG
jgi:hypothetical protein